MEPFEQKPEAETNFSNPWNVSDLSLFLRYCCPECDYKCEEVHLFCEHALDVHKNSNVLLENWRDEKYQTNAKQEILLEVKPELTLENQDILMHDFDFEALKSEGEDDVGSIEPFKGFNDKPIITPAIIKSGPKMFETNLQKSVIGDKSENTTEKPYVCSYCGKKFRQSGTAKVHERIHTGDKPYACKTCNYKSTTNGNLKLHEKTHLKEKIENILEPVRAVIFNSDFTNNPCAKCEEKFDDLMDLAVHYNKKHYRVNKQFQCPVCLKSFKQSIGQVKNHVNVTHLKRFQGQKKRPPKNTGLDSMIQCEYCPASYERKGSMKCHMSKYHPDKIVPDECEVQEKTGTTNQECSKCGKPFDDLIVLAGHFNREHDRIDNRYHCPICPKEITQFPQLTLHMKSAHLGLKKKCNECNKVFSLNSYRQHMKSSVCKSSDEVLHCDQCNYSSRVQRNYMKHIKMMHKKRNFLCDQCDKKFAEFGKLKQHKKWVHEGIKNVKKECNLCSKVFLHPNKYVQHYQTIHGETPPEYIAKQIMCDQCPSVFLQKASLQKHVDIAHSGLSFGR